MVDRVFLPSFIHSLLVCLFDFIQLFISYLSVLDLFLVYKKKKRLVKLPHTFRILNERCLNSASRTSVDI